MPGRLIERGNQRLPVNAFVSLKQFGSSRSNRALMYDLSTKGCSLVTNMPLRTGGKILVRIPGLEFWSATVVWRREEAAGVEFEKPLHPAVVEHYAKFYPAPEEPVDPPGNSD